MREMKRLFVDMDGVLVDFESGIARLDPADREAYRGRYDRAPGIFSLMDPYPGAIEAYAHLAIVFDTYLLSTAPWGNPSAWSDKLLWVKQHMGKVAYQRLILSHHKNLLDGDFLVDDRTLRGADRFGGRHLHFGTAEFPDWATVTAYLLANQ